MLEAGSSLCTQYFVMPRYDMTLRIASDLL